MNANLTAGSRSPTGDINRMDRPASKLNAKALVAGTIKRFPRERYEIQLASRMLELLKRGSDARRIKISHVRRSVQANEFVNDLKLHVASERLIDKLLIEQDAETTA